MVFNFKLIGLILFTQIATAQDLFDVSFNRILEIPASAGACSTVTDSQTGTTGGFQSIGFSSGAEWAAVKFTASSSYSVCKAVLRMLKAGSPTFVMNVYIYSDSAGLPGTQIGTGSASLNSSTLTTSEADATFTGIIASVNSAVPYWVVLKSTSPPNDFSNYAKWDLLSGGTAVKTTSSDGVSWVATTTPSGLYTLYK